MDISVIPNRLKPTRGSVRVGENIFECALGRGGYTDAKREGDGATPLGRFPLRRVLYRADRITEPACGLPTTAIKENDGWCDDPDDPNYNQPVKHPYVSSAEELWREDTCYDIVVVLGHNDDPIIPGAGSAIFLHVAKDNFSATEGCVAMRIEDLRSVLSGCKLGAAISIQVSREL